MTDKTSTETSTDSIDQEIDYSVVTSGPLAVADEYKQPGYVLKWIAGDSATQSYYRKLGHFVVQDPTKVGDGRATASTPFGSAVTYQSRCGTLLVLMAISEKNQKGLEEHQKKINAAQDAATGKVDGIPASATYTHSAKY
jgi:hypothetical protein